MRDARKSLGQVALRSVSQGKQTSWLTGRVSARIKLSYDQIW